MNKKHNKQTLFTKCKVLFMMLLMFSFIALPVSAESSKDLVFVSQMIEVNPTLANASAPKAKESSAVTKSGKFQSCLTRKQNKMYKKIKATNFRKVSKVSLPITSRHYYTNTSGLRRLQTDIARAYYAYIRDVTSAYWMYGFQYQYYTSGGYVSRVDFFVTEYYSGIKRENSEVQKELKKAVSSVKKRRSSSSRYATLKAIEDVVMDKITYGNQYVTIFREHTLTGALLKKYNNVAVCEGYAKLTKALCDKFNIPCMLIEDQNSNHMYNYVKMNNGKWYMMDATWDDDQPRREYFLLGKKHLDSSHQATMYNLGVTLQVPKLASENYK